MFKLSSISIAITKKHLRPTLPHSLFSLSFCLADWLTGCLSISDNLCFGLSVRPSIYPSYCLAVSLSLLFSLSLLLFMHLHIYSYPGMSDCLADVYSPSRVLEEAICIPTNEIIFWDHLHIYSYNS